MIDFPKDSRGQELLLFIERMKYERHLQREVAELLEREFNRLVDLMLSAKFRQLTKFQRQRTLELFREIDRVIKAGYAGVEQLHLKEMRGYAQLEAEVARSQVASTLPAGSGAARMLGPVLPKNYVASIARLPIEGLRIGEWFEAQAQTMSREARRIIQQGLVEGKGTAEISRRILADQRAEGPVLSRRAINEARIISRTTVNAVQNDAAIASHQALPPTVSDSYVWVSVLDSRVSKICASLNGRVFRYSDPERRLPPAHPNCRSTTRPLLRGTETTLATQREPHTMVDYAAWLRAKPVSVQNTILGPTRAGYWRDGKMSLADVIDADNRVLTLPELRARLERMGELVGAAA